jgi:hypothetical protein
MGRADTPCAQGFDYAEEYFLSRPAYLLRPLRPTAPGGKIRTTACSSAGQGAGSTRR